IVVEYADSQARRLALEDAIVPRGQSQAVQVEVEHLVLEGGHRVAVAVTAEVKGGDLDQPAPVGDAPGEPAQERIPDNAVVIGEGADAEGVPLVNTAVDRLAASGRLGDGAAFAVGWLIANGHAVTPQDAVEVIAYGRGTESLEPAVGAPVEPRHHEAARATL